MMLNRQLRYLFLLLLTFSTSISYSQVDTLFWFAAPEISASAGETPIYLRFMTYGNSANIEVSIPANGAFVPINLTVPANSVDSINLSSFIALIESPDGIAAWDTGIKITSTEKISAFYELKATTNKEIFSLKGTRALGDNFYTPFQKFWDNASTTPSSFSSIDIVATEDNTTVLITPRADIVGHLKDVTFSIILQTGQTFSAREIDLLGATSLAGSIVSSNKPIALTLFSGALTNAGCTSTMGDQITSEAYTGNDFIIHKGTSTSDRVYILATQNGTAITIENSSTTSALINWGETYEIALTDLENYITTSKPVYVWHASGYGCELSGAQVPHLLCAGTSSAAFTRTSSDSLGLLLYTRTGFEGQFEINGNPSLITAGQFTNVPGTGGAFKMAFIHYSTAQIPINSYNEVTNNGDIFGLGVLQGNNGAGSGYAYFSEFDSYPFVTIGNDTTICANTLLPLSGIVGGGDVTGVWSTSGFGTFANPTTSLVNTYNPSPLDTLISPIQLILTSTGNCTVLRDTIVLTVSPAPIVTASADQALCENNATAQLAGGVEGGATTGEWSSLGIGGTFLPDSITLNAQFVPSAADIASGSVQLVLTSTATGTCQAETDTMEIIFTLPPSVDAGLDTLYACENFPNTVLSGTVSGATTTGKWTTAGNGLFSPFNLDLNATYEPSPADVLAGSVMLYLESTSNGSCLSEMDSLLLIFTVSPTVDAGTNLIVCTNDASIDLSGVIGGVTSTGIWTGGLGSFVASDTDLNANYTPTAAEISSGTMFLTLTTTNNLGCLAETDNVQINFVAPPFANFNFTEECLYDGSVFTDFSLQGYGNIISWNWNFGDLSTGSNQNESHIYSAPGAYNVELITVSDAGCSDTALQVVQSFEIPTADFTTSSDCPNNQIIVDFTDNSTTVTDALNYWYYDFGGPGSIAAENATQLFGINGDYTITHIVGTINGCYDTIIEVLSIPPFPVASFSYNTTNGLNIGAIFNFINTSQNGTTYSWTFGNNNSSSDENPSNTYFSNGTYLVTQYVYGALGCVDSTSETIIINTVTTEITSLIPNAISPNGDNKNDVWKLEFIQLLYPNASVDIFNQWGQLLFNSDGYDIPWDGSYNGEPVPDGTYYYVINLNAGTEDDLFTGTVLVLKSKK
ncbi:MAG: gliding motility-associated-like protein [Flavobacteriaceae bacterium]|jgi:gliding motility-associated-like protein